MAGRRTIASVAGAAAFLLAAAAGATAAVAGGSGSASGTPAGKSTAAQLADPARLIDPDLYAAAIEVRETAHFGSVTVTPVGRSENSAALIASVLQDQDGLEELRAAVRKNGQLMAALKREGVSLIDLVSVTTDQNNNAILFVRE